MENVGVWPVIHLIHQCFLWSDPDPGSVERRQAKELRLKLIHAPESQRGPPGEAGVQVVVGNHNCLHPRGQRRLHAVGGVFEH